MQIIKRNPVPGWNIIIIIIIILAQGESRDYVSSNYIANRQIL